MSTVPRKAIETDGIKHLPLTKVIRQADRRGMAARSVAQLKTPFTISRATKNRRGTALIAFKRIMVDARIVQNLER